MELWTLNSSSPPALKMCHQQPEVGHCYASEERWFFNWGTGLCKTFNYSGCGGNNNNFDSQEACRDNCYPYIIPGKCQFLLNTQDIYAWAFSNYAESCYQPPDPGSCEKPLVSPAWHYDQENSTCRSFIRKDCEDEHHGNSFSSLTMCLNTCAPWQSLEVEGQCMKGRTQSHSQEFIIIQTV